MSGGSFNNIYWKLEDECLDRMEEPLLDAMLVDFIKVLHDLEWWQSGDYGEEQYRQTAREFKEKWFGVSEDTIRRIVSTELEQFAKRIVGR